MGVSQADTWEGHLARAPHWRGAPASAEVSKVARGHWGSWVSMAFWRLLLAVLSDAFTASAGHRAGLAAAVRQCCVFHFMSISTLLRVMGLQPSRRP